MSPRFAAPLCAIVAVAALLVFGTSARAEEEAAAEPTIYKWVDENGVAHYTTDRDRIPSEVGTRVERAPSRPAVAAPHREDLMRDAVKTQPPATVVAPAPAPAPAPVAAAPLQEAPAPVAVDEVLEVESTEPLEEVEAVESVVEQEIPAPLATDAEPEIDPVSAPPPAPVAALEPQQAAELSKLDAQIDAVESQIAVREEKLAALISTSDERRTTALVDDPSFREISQQLPKLQAELQTLRDRRNKIQPTAPTP
ncbi:MAG: DUF4124 domain-containing protein [Myxococcota bacterium]|jgi:hypothetical protein|nr:DUF4124 domain-containing protein [Myxococcota bacterium]